MYVCMFAYVYTQGRLSEAMSEVVGLRACTLPDSVASVEEIVQERLAALATVAKLTGDLQVERANVARAREETLAQRAARDQAEARDRQAAEALRIQAAAHDTHMAEHTAMVQEEMKRAELDIKARAQAEAVRQLAQLTTLQQQLDVQVCVRACVCVCDCERV